MVKYVYKVFIRYGSILERGLIYQSATKPTK